MKRILVWTAALLLATLPTARAQNANTLTRAEIEKGWLLLFDGATTWGWAPSTGGLAIVDWQVMDHALTPPVGPGCWYVSTTAFSSYEVTGECWAENKLGAMVGIAESRQEHGKPTEYNSALAFSGGAMMAGRWTTFRLTVRPGKATLTWQGRRPETHTFSARPTHLELGYFGLGKVMFRNLKLRPTGLKSLFNGRDLAGWNVVPGHASVYTVTPEGWLNVKNGNGDIHTEGQYGDFVLQLDILSNGDHLNSGVFFRANKGAFWSGYEAQIRNQWEGDDRSKAVDYGTGGLYNRQPARRVVSSDREWFKMTVVAHGYHIATWVNGYLITDFMDTRPIDEGNARQGARKTAGTISLQGHDPTTDLSFRNIQVGVYPTGR